MPDALVPYFPDHMTLLRFFNPRGALDGTEPSPLVREGLSFLLFFSFFSRAAVTRSRGSVLACLFAVGAAAGCVSQGAARNDASPSGAAGSAGDAAPAVDATDALAPDSGAGDGGGLRPCAPPADPAQPYPTLAATGCMDSDAIARFVSSAYGYEVNSPLWSDQADKARAFVLPPGGKIHVVNCAAEPAACLDAADDGKWVFPAGTIFLKSFGFDGKLVETRLLVALSDGTWVGYSYQWNEGQTSAALVASAGASVSFNTGGRTVDWTYPGRRDCTECHTRSAGWTLGPETAQMNRTLVTAALGSGNQIDKLAAAGLFDSAPGKPFKAALVTPYAGQLGAPPASATVTERARSYLHANCAFCHRPDGEFNSVDLRYDTAFKNTGLCNAVPAKGTQGVANATNLTPRHPELSTTWLRMSTLGKGRMPPLASAVVDQDALDLVSGWINDIQTCP
jgi:uncharacterized repeat protein (TIGR03806 family)